MAKGASHNYKFGQKNNWRRAIWNEVLRRTAGREKNELILYLAGPQDIDREVATSKGVPAQNLIAIDRCQRNIDAVRASKVPAVCGDVMDVLWSWPDSRPVCAVLLDFCSGITPNTISAYDVFERAALRNAAIMINLQRGRDAWSNEIRDALDVSGLLRPLCHHRRNAAGYLVEDIVDAKHRAYQFLLFHSWDTLSSIRGEGVASRKEGKASMLFVPPEVEGRHFEWCRLVFDTMMLTMRPRFFSYQSGAVCFDSAVFNHSLDVLLPDHTLTPETLGAIICADAESRAAKWRVPAVARRIAATLAVRTSRIAQ